MEDDEIKIVLLGESGVGKTNLINGLFDKPFNDATISTNNSYFYDGEYIYNKKKYLYNIWDTAGQEQYKALNKIFIKDSKIVIVVYAIDNKNSFKEIDSWIEYVKEMLVEGEYILALVANKNDLYENQEVPDEDGEKLAKKIGAKFKVTSARNDIKGFKKFLNVLLNDYISLSQQTNDKDKLYKSESFRIKKKNEKDDRDEAKSHCC